MAVKKLILMGIEATEDTEETLLAADIIDSVDLTIERYAGPSVTRNVDRHLVGNQHQINASPRTIAGFGCYATGAGAAGTKAPYDVPLRACGFAQTINAGVDATYDVVATGHESATLYDYREDIGQLQKSTGMRGSVKFSMSQGQLPMFEFSNLIGSYLSPESGSPPGSLDWAAWDQDVLPMTEENTPTLTLDGYAAATSQFEIDWAFEVARLDLANLKSTRLPDWAPAATFTILAPTFAQKNYYAKLESHKGVTEVAVNLAHGTAAGDIVAASGSKFQILKIDETEVENELGYSISGIFIDTPQIVIR